MNVRAKCSAVNSVFLVQLRKNSADDSRGFLVGQENCLPTVGCVAARFSARSHRDEWMLLARQGGLSTGRAQEMQKGSSQFSVLSSQFSVLSSQFSVPSSSQFSVLSSQSEMLGIISKLLGDCQFVAPFALSHRFTGITRAEVGCGGRRIYCCARNSFSRWTL